MKHLLLFALLTDSDWKIISDPQPRDHRETYCVAAICLDTDKREGTSVQSINPQPWWIFNNAFKCIYPLNDLNTGYNNDLNFGCYCDFIILSKFSTSSEGVAGCCNTRDKCYAQVNKLENCGSLIRNPYLSSYFYSCSGDEVICSEKNNRCEDIICNCDRQAAACFSKTPPYMFIKGIRC